ncbi:MAG TPA: glycosyltransferase [Chlorobiota bacterium]|nr:glycosyltransferase [Chlorobiota bacterium]
MRVLFVSHSSVVDVYQDKLRWIAQNSDVDLTALLPERYFEGGRIVTAHRGDGTYTVKTLKSRCSTTAKQNAWHFAWLGQTVRRLQPDIVHLEEEPESYVTHQIIRKSLALKKRPKIVVFSWRNMTIPYDHWQWWHPKRILQNTLQHMTLPHVDHLLVGTHESEPLFRKVGYEGPIHVIPQYGVNPEIYSPHAGQPGFRDKLNIPRDAIVVGFVGRVLKMKGLDVLVDAIAGLNRNNLHLVVVGRGDYTSEVRQRASSLGLSDRLHIVENVQASDIPSAMKAMDMLCIPSLTMPHWKEQFGRVIIEAMACGVPVIGSTSGEIPYVIGNAGLICTEGSIDELRAAIGALADSPEKRQSLSNLGLERVHTLYTNEHIASSIVNVYRSLLHKETS